MEAIFSDRFKKELEKVRNPIVQLHILKLVERIVRTPTVGKPLRYDWKGYRSVRLPPYRIIYRIDDDAIFFSTIDHRDSVYD